MVIVRNRIASLGAGGPRQFAEIRDTILAVAEEGELSAARSELDNAGFDTIGLSNAPIVIASPTATLEDAIDRLAEDIDDAGQAIQDIQEARQEEDSFIESTTATIRATADLLDRISQFTPINNAGFAHSFADFGPENLRMSPDSLLTLDDPNGEEDTLQDTINTLNIPDAWAITRGEGAIVAIFDTGYARDLIDRSRIVATFHDDSVDSVFESQEGHGTMCAGAAAANQDEGVPFDGFAPDAGVILVRVTDDEGQIRSDIITRALDWIAEQGRRLNRPIVTNHSYGTPICSTLRRPTFCDNATAQMIRVLNSTADITSCYAAGNEAGYCGHRLSGITNGITAHNSLGEIITVGALLSDGREAQRYSSHGRGDCAPRADPKPNVSCRIPRRTYYGTEDGWEIKDMSTGLFGSGGGTSHASPNICGMLALIQSAADEPLQTEQIKQLIENNSVPPRPTQVNQFGFFAGPAGWDARFGFGQFNVAEAITEV